MENSHRRGRARQAAAKAAAPRELTHEAVPGSIVRSADADAPAVSRVAQSLGLSVMKEAATVSTLDGRARLEVNRKSADSPPA